MGKRPRKLVTCRGHTGSQVLSFFPVAEMYRGDVVLSGCPQTPVTQPGSLPGVLP